MFLLLFFIPPLDTDQCLSILFLALDFFNSFGSYPLLLPNGFLTVLISNCVVLSVSLLHFPFASIKNFCLAGLLKSLIKLYWSFL